MGATEHHSSELMVYIRLTTKGRKLVRQALDIHTPARLPVGTLQEWDWRALVYAYKVGEQGVREWPKGIGHMTLRRLKEYRVKGQDRPLDSNIIRRTGNGIWYRDLYPAVDAHIPQDPMI